MLQVGVQERFGRLVLACACYHAGFDVAVISLRVCAVVGEHARRELVPRTGRQLGRMQCILGAVCAESDGERDGGASVVC